MSRCASIVVGRKAGVSCVFLSGVALLAAVWVPAGTGLAGQAWFSLRGSMTYPPSPVQDFFFTQSGLEPNADLHFITYANNGGTNIAGQDIPSGGIDSTLTLYSMDGNQIAYNDDYGGTVDSNIAILLPTAPYYTLRLAPWGGSYIYNGTWAADLINNTSNAYVVTLPESNSVVASLILGGSGSACAYLGVASGTMRFAELLSARSHGAITVSGGTLKADGNIVLDEGSLDYISGTFQWAGGKSMEITSAGRFEYHGDYALPAGAQVKITDPNSRMEALGSLIFGGGAKVTVTGGGLLKAGEVIVIGTDGNSGSLTVDGSGSSAVGGPAWTSTWGYGGGEANVTFSNGATGSFGGIQMAEGIDPNTRSLLRVLSGAQVTTSYLKVGYGGGTGSKATMIVDGNGSAVTHSGAYDLWIGSSGGGSGSLSVTNNGTFTTGTGTTYVGKTGTVTVNGGIFNAKGDIWIGGGRIEDLGGGYLGEPSFKWEPNHAMDVSAGGSFYYAGAYEMPVGASVTVQDANSRFEAWMLNLSSGASIAVSGGGQLLAPGVAYVGHASRGSLTVDGPGSAFSTDSAAVGTTGGDGNVTFSNGAAGSISWGLFVGAGYGPNTIGVVRVLSGAQLSLGDILEIGTCTGAASSGKLIVEGTGSTVTHAAADLFVGWAGDGAGEVDVNWGGVFNGTTGTTWVKKGGYWGSAIVVNGGTYNANGPVVIDGGYISATAGTFRQRDSGIETLIPARIGDGNLVTTLYEGTIYIGGGSVALGRVVRNGGQITFNSGSFGFDGNLTVGSGGLLGPVLALGGYMHLALSGTTTVDSGSTLTLYGGSLSTNRLVNNGTFTFDSGTLVIRNQDIALTTGGLLGADLSLPSGKNLYVLKDVSVAGGSTLTVDGGTFQAGRLDNSGTIVVKGGKFTVIGTGVSVNQASGRLFLEKDARATVEGNMTNAGRITLEGGAARLDGNATLTNTGLITGDGEISKNLANAAGGEVRVETGKTLLVSGASGANAGTFNVLGGTIEFARTLTNAPSGKITGRGTILADGNLVNNGQVWLSAGLTDVFGDITNNGGSKIIVSGGGTATFYGPVDNNSGSEFRVSTGSTAVFFGNVNGTSFFTGSGTKIFEDGTSTLGDVVTSGSTVVEQPAAVSATCFREKSLTVNGLVVISPNGGPAGTSLVKDLSVSSSTGKLDLNDNDLIVDYQPGGSPIDDITAWITQGFNGGDWGGKGITSAETGNPAYGGLAGIGFADNAAGLTGEFSGQTVDDSSVLVKFTWYGDADLNGAVNTDDFALWVAGFSGDPGTSQTWLYGDFDYNGAVNTDDFALWAYAFDGQTTVLSEGLGAAVPEPATMGLLTLGALGLLLRRRTRLPA